MGPPEAWRGPPRARRGPTAFPEVEALVLSIHTGSVSLVTATPALVTLGCGQRSAFLNNRRRLPGKSPENRGTLGKRLDL